jgi:cytochrome P450
MCRIIKEETLKYIKAIQDKAVKEIDLASFTLDLQAQIIISVSVGTNLAKTRINWEKDDGSMENISLSDCLDRLVTFTIGRSFHLLNLLVSELTPYVIMPADRRYYRNVLAFRAVIQRMIDERRKKMSGSDNQENDMLLILIKTDFYKSNDDGAIIDEIITFFLAGFKTIQVSTTNLIYYLIKHPEIKLKLLDEVVPYVHAAR